ncbi:MAG: hypothetical protein AB7S26_09800 [Sandaracinaceae bacterium]
MTLLLTGCALSHEPVDWTGWELHVESRGLAESQRLDVDTDAAYVARRFHQLERCEGTLSPDDQLAWLTYIEDFGILARHGALDPRPCDDCGVITVEVSDPSRTRARVFGTSSPAANGAFDLFERFAQRVGPSCARLPPDPERIDIVVRGYLWDLRGEMRFELRVPPGDVPSGSWTRDVLIDPAPDMPTPPACPDAFHDDDRAAFVRALVEGVPAYDGPWPEPAYADPTIVVRLADTRSQEDVEPAFRDWPAAEYRVNEASPIGSRIVDLVTRCPER